MRAAPSTPASTAAPAVLTVTASNLGSFDLAVSYYSVTRKLEALLFGGVWKTAKESCRRSVSSFECAVCISGHCGGCRVGYTSMMKQAPESQEAPILP